jgi:hypothetical protein
LSLDVRRPAAAQASQKIAEWAEVDIQITGVKPELLRELVHFLFQFHQCETDPLNLLITQTPALHTPHGLPLEHLTEELDQRQNQLG